MPAPAMRRFAAVLALLLLLAPARAATVLASVASSAGKPVEDAVVVMMPASRVAARHRATATIEQHDREFLPYVSVVQTGTAVDFPNHDSVKHHVYSFSPAKPFEIKLYAGTPAQPVVFDKPGEVVLGCNIHDWMVAHVLVVDSPYFAKTGKDGKAAIPNVPVGRYRLRVWHPRQAAQQALRDIEIGSASPRLSLVLDVRPREFTHKSEAESDHY
jgi:plastocyanin